MTKQPTAILFDLDQTLTDRRASLSRWAQRLLDDFATVLPANHGQSEALMELVFEQDRAAYHTKEQIFVHVAAALPWRRRVLVDEIRLHWSAIFPRSAVGVPGLHETIGALKQRGVKVGVATNGSVTMQYGKLDCLDLWDACDPVIVSGDIGVQKPNDAFYEIALERLGLPGNEVWFVGDYPDNDIFGPARAGMIPVWVRGQHPWPDGRPQPDLVIDRLEEVVALLP